MRDNIDRNVDMRLKWDTYVLMGWYRINIRNLACSMVLKLTFGGVCECVHYVTSYFDEFRFQIFVRNPFLLRGDKDNGHVNWKISDFDCDECPIVVLKASEKTEVIKIHLSSKIHQAN